MAEVLYGKTTLGQIVFDLAFTNLSTKYLARKHRKPIAEIRKLRSSDALRKLRKKNRLRSAIG